MYNNEQKLKLHKIVLEHKNTLLGMDNCVGGCDATIDAVRQYLRHSPLGAYEWTFTVTKEIADKPLFCRAATPQRQNTE